jgi:hypothetical protein
VTRIELAGVERRTRIDVRCLSIAMAAVVL